MAIVIYTRYESTVVDMDVISFTLTPTTSGYARYDYCGYLYIITEVGWLHAQTSCLAVVYFILYLRGIQLHVNLKERKGTSNKTQNTMKAMASQRHSLRLVSKFRHLSFCMSLTTPLPTNLGTKPLQV
jgi:hypothetical protein